MAKCFLLTRPYELQFGTRGLVFGTLGKPKIVRMSKFGRALRVTLGKRAIGSCWAKGPAAVGIRGWLGKVGPYGPEWPKGLWGDGMGAFGAHGANGAFGGYSEAIPSGWCLTSGGNRFEKFCGIP